MTVEPDDAPLETSVPADETPVVLEEYGDYQCPACGYYHNMVKKLKSEFGDQLKVKFFHFPLQQHQYAALASRAAEAARNQGKFWEMHDKLYSNQKEWSQGNATTTIYDYAKAIELDMKQFKSEINARETQQAVMEDKKQGVNAGVNSTPTFILNGEMLETPRSYKAFKSKVAEAINKQEN
jgi:protein-disulfide isomerase